MSKTNVSRAQPPDRDGLDNFSTNNESNSVAAEVVLHDKKVLCSLLKDRQTAYHKPEKRWYSFTGSFWKAATTDDISNLAENIVLENAPLFRSRINSTNFQSIAKRYLTRAANQLTVTPEMKDFPPGLAFLNGYLEFASNKVVPHSPDRFVTTLLDIEYSAEESLNVLSIQFLCECVNCHSDSLFFLRSLLRRSMCPDPSLQTGYYIYGGPNSGKSTFINLLSLICGPRFLVVDPKDLHKSAVIKNMYGKRIIQLN